MSSGGACASPASPSSPSLYSTAAHLDKLCGLLSRRHNSVVAFLGAGFLGPLGAQYASWGKLLQGIVEQASPGVRPELLALLDGANSSDAVFQRVAQLAEDDLGEEGLQRVASQLLTLPAAVYSDAAFRRLAPEEAARVQLFRKRLALLRLLPFRAILTTNFTTFGEGARVVSLTHERVELALRELLRGDSREPRVGRREVELLRCMNGGDAAPPPWGPDDPLVIHIHGTCVSPVVTKLGYRALLHRTPSFLPFMRTLMSTHALVYLGFSFSDAYLDEIRSEALSMLSPMARKARESSSSSGGGSKRRREEEQVEQGFDSAPAAAGASAAIPEPLAFAFTPLPTGEAGEQSLLLYHRKHEGMALLAYEVPPSTPYDHSRCDALLEHLIRKVCVPFRLAEALKGRRLLVHDKLREGFAEECVPLLSQLVLATVDPGAERSALEGRWQAAAERQRRYVLLYDATKQLEAAKGQDFFVPPPREPEQWPLAEGGCIEVVYLRRQLLVQRLQEAGLPGSFGQLAALPAFDCEGEELEDIGELTHPAASCGASHIVAEDGRDIFVPRREAEQQAPSSSPQQAGAASHRRVFAALVTLNGYRGPRQRSYFMNCMSLVHALPQEEQMPVIVFGRPLSEAKLAHKNAESRAMGALSYECTMDGVIASLFEALV